MTLKRYKYLRDVEAHQKHTIAREMLDKKKNIPFKFEFIKKKEIIDYLFIIFYKQRE